LTTLTTLTLAALTLAALTLTLALATLTLASLGLALLLLFLLLLLLLSLLFLLLFPLLLLPLLLSPLLFLHRLYLVGQPIDRAPGLADIAVQLLQDPLEFTVEGLCPRRLALIHLATLGALSSTCTGRLSCTASGAALTCTGPLARALS